MSDFGKCPTCGLYARMDRHQCPPLWHATMEEGEEGGKVYALDAAEAAEKYAERYDSRWSEWPDYEREVWVRRDGSDDWEHYFVDTQVERSYHATLA